MSHRFGKPTNPTVARKKGQKHFTDVTLAEFADCKVPRGNGRQKKGTRNILSGVKEIAIDNKEKSWEERLENINETFDFESSGEEDEDDIDGLTPRKKRNTKKRNDKCDQQKDDTGVIYTLDLWFLISEYIIPEQVNTFSQICKSSYFVVNTPKFWINLYKRYYRRVSMPVCLQPHCLEVHHGLKAAVVQALYYFYLPFSTSAQASVYLNDFQMLDQLIGMQCLLMWIEKVYDEQCNKWIYKFKLKKYQYGRNSNINSKKNKLRKRDNVNANPEDGCKMLLVPCRDFIAIPCVSGYTLKKVTGFWKEMKLIFTLGPLSKSSTEDITLILTPCYRPSLFNWWHPMYYNRKGVNCVNS